MRPHAVVGVTLLLASVVLTQPVSGQIAYRGSDACLACHGSTDVDGNGRNEWNDFRTSGHPYKLRKAEDTDTWAIPLPPGYQWTDISYVIGGWGWKIRFMDNDGYIITKTDQDGDGLPLEDGGNQFNLATGQWSNYHAGEVKIYNCGSCHTTGFVAGDGLPGGGDGQGGLDGIDGTWVFEGVQCEACHGPAGDHIDAGGLLIGAGPVAGTTAADCGTCHIRGDETAIEASGGFIRHHEQWDELVQSPHANLDCVDCHDPHKKAEFSIHTSCEDCHAEGTDMARPMKKLGKKHTDFGVTCVDCHMPYAAKSAVALGTYKGDVRSHLFDISNHVDQEMFNPEGTLATGILTGEYVCLSCHENIMNKLAAKDAKALDKGKQLKSILWARKGVRKIHKGAEKDDVLPDG